jgi:hypothetical protein
VFVTRSGPRYTEADARAAIAASRSYAEALRRLGMRAGGGNWRTLERYATTVWRIPVDHFDPFAARRDAAGRRRAPARPLAELLTEHSRCSRGTLKRRLYASGLKQRRCELCGQGEQWRGRRMALILDHINGVGSDNRLENLRIVCPNCAATLDTHCGRNTAINRVCVTCGVSFRPSNRTQRHCSRTCGGRSEAARLEQVARRGVERPPYEELVAQVAATSWSAVGRRYGVSDNAVRKWVRAYERERGEAGRLRVR